MASEGFSLCEVAIATAILATAIVSLAELFGIASVANRRARDATYAIVLACQKLEQLRALTYTVDAAGQPTTDTTTDTAIAPPGAAGGTGLSDSPSGSLDRNTAGFVDYLDGNGASLGGGATAPHGTMYVRRWSIEPSPDNPGSLLILQVRVLPLRGDRALDRAGSGRMPDEARVTSLRMRRSS
jgi:type II secretory pathway pseudopilin PulG